MCPPQGALRELLSVIARRLRLRLRGGGLCVLWACPYGTLHSAFLDEHEDNVKGGEANVECGRYTRMYVAMVFVTMVFATRMYVAMVLLTRMNVTMVFATGMSVTIPHINIMYIYLFRRHYLRICLVDCTLLKTNRSDIRGRDGTQRYAKVTAFLLKRVTSCMASISNFVLINGFKSSISVLRPATIGALLSGLFFSETDQSISLNTYYRRHVVSTSASPPSPSLRCPPHPAAAAA